MASVRLFDFCRPYGFGLPFPDASGCALSADSGAASSPDTSPGFGAFPGLPVAAGATGAGATVRLTPGWGAFSGLLVASGGAGAGAVGRGAEPGAAGCCFGATGAGTTSRATPG
jgi:hypothetical protein